MRWFLLAIVLAATLATAPARADWFDGAWPYRRALTVSWDAEHRGDDDEIAVADFYTGGHTLPRGDDIRVATSDGHPVAVRILKIGPGDTARIIFKLKKTEKTYAVYWGNPTPHPLQGELAAEVPIRFGVLFEARGLTSSANVNANFQRAWDNGKPDFGGNMIDKPFIGFNPCTNSDRTVDRLSGSLFAPADGDYEFAGACDDAGLLCIDGQPILLIPGCPSDTRFNKTINLTRGRHAFLMYHANYSAQMIVSLGWKPPDAAKVQIIGPETFGICPRAEVGPLEQIKQSLVPDFTVENVAETFEHQPGARPPEMGNYSQLFRFKAIVPNGNSAIRIRWDFGDGQSAIGSNQDHVFMTPGVCAVKLTYRLGETTQTQTNRVLVERDLTHPDHPQANDPPVQSAIVAKYDVDTMPANWLGWAIVLHARAKDESSMKAVALRLASEAKHGDVNEAFASLQEASENARADDAIAIWKAVPPSSDLQPRAIKTLTEKLLWEQADFSGAEEALMPFQQHHDAGLDRRLAVSLLLQGKIDEAKKIFATLHTQETAARAAAISGAMARGVEYYLTEKDAEAGDNAWEQWQTRFPESFLQGYSALLRVKLMVLADHPIAAAKVAEAFAKAVPSSSYAPQLLDQASKLLATSDPSKSEAIHTELKQRYPEDPLSN
ncbi:MAG: hypothetical protein JO353_01670 [Phycisphaerae bacterium]|nr:hypothetical protein [Phycisphaerae bacterium]